MEGANQLRNKFTIPKKKPRLQTADEEEEAPRAEFKLLEKSDRNFAKLLNIVYSRFDETPLKNGIQVTAIKEIENKYLNNKYCKYKSAITPNGATAREFFVFFPCTTYLEMVDIATQGLKFRNSLYSDLGTNSEGVYVFKHPDLMIAHPFFQGHSIYGMCFKFTAVGSKYYKVALGSDSIRPDPLHIGHTARLDSQPANGKANRLERHRCDQMYLYDTVNGTSDTPNCLLPYFSFELKVASRGEIPLNLRESIHPEIMQYRLFQWKYTEGIFGLENLTFFTFCPEPTMPFGLLADCISFEQFITWELFLEHPAIRKLFERKHWGKLTSSTLPEIRLIEDDEDDTRFHIIPAILRGRSKNYGELTAKMKTAKLGIYTSIENCFVQGQKDDHLELIGLPPSEVTMRLGLPFLPNEDYLYCFIIKSGEESLLDRPLDYALQEQNETILSKPSLNDVIMKTPNFHANALEEFNEYQKKNKSAKRKYVIDEPEDGEECIIYAPTPYRMDITRYNLMDQYETAIMLQEPESGDRIEVEGVHKEPLKGGLKKTVGQPKKAVRFSENLCDYSDGVPTTQSMYHDHTVDTTRLRKQTEMAEFSKTKLSENQKIEDENRIKLQHEKLERNNALFQNAFGEMAKIGMGDELAPFVPPVNPNDKKPQFLSKISSLPLPNVSRLGAKTLGAPSSLSQTSEFAADLEVADMVFDADSTSGVREPEEEKTDKPQASDPSFEDPFNIDYDAMLLGPLNIDEEALRSADNDNQANDDTETEKNRNDNEARSSDEQQSQTNGQSTENMSLTSGVSPWLNKLASLGYFSSSQVQVPKPMDVDAPASPEPPASPTSVATKPDLSGINEILGKLGKSPLVSNTANVSQDVDLRPLSGRLVSEPKMIPLSAKVEFSVVNNQKPGQLVKPVLPAFHSDDDDVQMIASSTSQDSTMDKDERAEHRRHRDDNDRDYRRRHDDKDRDRRDRDKERRSRDSDYERRQSRDDSDYRRSRDREKDRYRDRDRSRERDRRYNREDDKGRDRGRNGNKFKEHERRSPDTISVPPTSMSRSSNDINRQVNGFENKQLTDVGLDAGLKVPSPVPQEAIMFSNAEKVLGLSKNFQSAVTGNKPPLTSNWMPLPPPRVNAPAANTPASPPPPSSPDASSSLQISLPGAKPSKFVQDIPLNSNGDESMLKRNEFLRGIVLPPVAVGPFNTPPPPIPVIPVRDETWRQLPPPSVVNPVVRQHGPGIVLYPRLSAPAVPSTMPTFSPYSRPPPSLAPTFNGAPFPPGAVGGFAQRFQIDLPDAIMIIPDELALKIHFMPLQKITELFEKLLHYRNQHPQKVAYMLVHHHIMQKLQETANDRYAQALQNQCRDYLTVLLQYKEKGVVKTLPEHFCDKNASPGVPHQICCGPATRDKLRDEGYKTSKIIIFTPISEGTPLHNRLKEDGIKMASSFNIINFDTL